MRHVRIPTILAFASAAAIAACGAATDSAAKPVVSPPGDSTHSAAVVEANTQAVPPQGAQAPAHADSTGQPAPTPAAVANTPADSLLRGVVLPEGRSKQDRASLIGAIRAGLRSNAWPVKGPEPLPGALLPEKRIVAFYGNPLSQKMGVLGEYPVDEMLRRLDVEVDRWRKADPNTPVQPALHLIAVVAQGGPGRDGMYRLRMDSTLIEKVYGWAKQHHAILFLDIQVAKSNLQAELPRLLPFLSRPDVHLGVDPEFSMHYSREGLPPGKKIGEMHAADVNYAIQTLAKLVSEKKLPPKILVVHRFTSRMVPDAEDIKPDPRVQVVMNMDGWGPPWLKFDSYADYIVRHPVEYTGFKLFFHNDTKKGDPLITPAELLLLHPRPIYIQYQ